VFFKCLAVLVSAINSFWASPHPMPVPSVHAIAALVKQTGTFKGDLLPAVRNQGVSQYHTVLSY
jgi:hypothetical protein